MTAILTTFAFVCAVLAALMVGLWQGERGRRIAAENRLAFGVPDWVNARRVTSEPTGEEIATRAGKPFTEESVKRGVEQYLKECKDAGIEMTPQEAKLHVEEMLWQATGGAHETEEPAGMFG